MVATRAHDGIRTLTEPGSGKRATGYSSARVMHDRKSKEIAGRRCTG